MCPASQSDEGLHLPPISVIDDFLPSRTWQPQLPPSPWTPLSQSSPFQPVITPSSSSIHSPPPTSSTSVPVRSGYSPPIHHDIDQILQHCHYLCENIQQRKNQWTDDDDPKPWLDDMIGRANEVLNALLRLRKQQIRPHMDPIRNDRPTTTLSSPPSTTTAAWHTGTLSLTKLRQRRRGKSATFQGRCHSCNISETPEWRRGPDGARTLCNACGLHYAKLTRKKAQQQQQQQQHQQQQQQQQQQLHHNNMSSSYR